MSWMDGVWMVVGVTFGILHAAELWRSAKRPAVTSAVMGLARLLIVGFALTAAAVLGGILPAFAGWVAGYFATVATVLVIRSRSKQRGPTL